MTRLAALAAAILASVLVASCSGKARPDGAGSSGPAGSGGAGSAAVPAGGSGSSGSAANGPPPVAPLANGDVQIRVEWPDVPVAARASAGRTPCNTPRSPSVAPTATWGIPDALVIIESGRIDTAESRIVLSDCALSPRLTAGGTLVVESAADRPAAVSLSKRADISRRGELSPLSAAAPPRVLRLPIAGHAVTLPLDPGGVYELSTSDKDPETAWLAAGIQGTTLSVTDASGQAVIRDMLPGTRAVTAWLPPRAGQPARLARGSITVVPNQLAELTLVLAPAP